MPAHHKRSATGVAVAAPQSGPKAGDGSYRAYFETPQAYQDAMKVAADLERRGMPRRAWRVRLNLDGPPPKNLQPPEPEPVLDTAEIKRKKKRLQALLTRVEELKFEIEERD